jgi:putative ABC transport system substrate-binding protein
VLSSLAADDPESRARNSALEERLQQLGWAIGRNVLIDYRSGARNAEQIRSPVAELIALNPDVLFGTSSLIVAGMQQATRTTPIVFAAVIDPVGGGLVTSLSRPGGNATGFAIYEYGIGGKWLELIKELSPQTARVAVIRDPTNTAAVGELGAIQVVAPSFGVELRPVDVRSAAEMDPTVTAFAGDPNGALIVLNSPLATLHREIIIRLAARHRLPAIYPFRLFVKDGGLISYGPDLVDQYRRAADYIDRILKGERPADLAVQAPTKYELLINLKTAKTLGLMVPPTLLARADDVIE